MPGHDIFLSYASEDRDRIGPLIRALESTGWTVFWDRTIPTGKTWSEVLEEEVTTCRSMAVVWSERSVKSDWVQEEAGEGKRRRILFPVRIDAVDPPFGFRNIQAADFLGWDGTPSAPPFQRIVKDLSALLGIPPFTAKEEEDRLRAAREAELKGAADANALREQERQDKQPGADTWQDLIRLAAARPRSGIRSAWQEVESALKQAAKANMLEAAPGAWSMPMVLGALLLKTGAISDGQYDLLSRLRRLSTEAERAPVDSISPDAAADFVGLALRFAASLPTRGKGAPA